MTEICKDGAADSSSRIYIVSANSSRRIHDIRNAKGLQYCALYETVGLVQHAVVHSYEER